MRTGISIEVSSSDRRRLEALVGDRNAAQKHAWRAAIVLLSADGVGNERDRAADGQIEEVRMALDYESYIVFTDFRRERERISSLSGTLWVKRLDGMLNLRQTSSGCEGDVAFRSFGWPISVSLFAGKRLSERLFYQNKGRLAKPHGMVFKKLHGYPLPLSMY